MSKLFQIILLTIAFATTALAQEQPIPSTPLWTFSSPTYAYSGNLELQIKNKNNAGILHLYLTVSDPAFYIGGNVYLFLEDGNVITCTDKNIRSVSGSIIQSSYLITPNEIGLLKKQKLTDVRFKVVGNQTTFSSPTGYFTAHNKIRSFGMPDKTYDTVTDIKQLFP